MQPQSRTDGAWLPLADVLRHVGALADSANERDVDDARLAAAAYVERARPELLTVTGDVVTFDAPPDVKLGAQLLAARLYARKGSPAGLASFGEFGPAAVRAGDPDVDRLLSTGRHSRVRVG